jgi:threonine/homoserine efflux transporter RhtA
MWFVYGDYAPRYFYWEGALMLRKALVVAFTVTMVPYGVEMQAHMVLGLLIVAFALQISLQPYASPLVNSLDGER